MQSRSYLIGAYHESIIAERTKTSQLVVEKIFENLL